MRKDIFIVNPIAGKHRHPEEIRAQIVQAAEAHGLDYEILVTEYKGHAIQLVDQIAAQYAPEICRFYACGGDGTINEVVNGAAVHENAELACYACGTGNDFIKIFDSPEKFLDLDALIEAPVTPIDVMRMNDHYAINLCSSGIDARVAGWVGRYNTKIPLSGKLVYDLSLIVNFFGRLHRHYAVEIDGERLDGEYSIVVAGSGRYYGGGYYVLPEAEPDDGKLDFLLIRKVSHLYLLRSIGKFQNGQHDAFGDKQIYRRGRTMTLHTKNPEPCNFDGEIERAPEAVICLSPHKLPVALPGGAKVIHHETGKERKPVKT